MLSGVFHRVPLVHHHVPTWPNTQLLSGRSLELLVLLQPRLRWQLQWGSVQRVARSSGSPRSSPDFSQRARCRNGLGNTCGSPPKRAAAEFGASPFSAAAYHYLEHRSSASNLGRTGGSAWESNPPPPSEPTPDNGFEDRREHQPPSASGAILAAHGLPRLATRSLSARTTGDRRQVTRASCRSEPIKRL